MQSSSSPLDATKSKGPSFLHILNLAQPVHCYSTMKVCHFVINAIQRQAFLQLFSSSDVDRATIQSPRLHPASGTTPSPPAALDYSSQPIPGHHTPRWPLPEFNEAVNPSHWKPGPCGRPITSRAADHAT